MFTRPDKHTDTIKLGLVVSSRIGTQGQPSALPRAAGRGSTHRPIVDLTYLSLQHIFLPGGFSHGNRRSQNAPPILV